MYEYKAVVKRWKDGDTLEVRVDCGFHIWVETTIRVYGLNTPEKTNPTGWQAALDFAQKTLPVGSQFVLKSYKTADGSLSEADKYGGRWDGKVIVDNSDYATLAIAAGVGVAYYGGTKV